MSECTLGLWLKVKDLGLLIEDLGFRIYPEP